MKLLSPGNVILVTAIIFLTSCGGGGGGSESPAPPTAQVPGPNPPPAPPIPNALPILSSATSVSIPENTTDIGYTAIASDNDGEIVTFGLEATGDNLHFNINSTTGKLDFNEPPDYENPLDSDGNNEYNVGIVLSDAVAEAVVQIAVRVTNETQPAFKITYPTPNANILAGFGITTTTVSGRVIDEEGGVANPDDVSSVNVNGFTAVQDIDHPERWSVEIPISEGANSINATMVPANGSNTQNITQTVYNQHVLRKPASIALDKEHNRLFVVDEHFRNLYAVDLDSNEITLVADMGYPTDDLPPQAIAYDSVNNRIFSAHRFSEGITELDLGSGNIRIVSDTIHGAGVDLGNTRLDDLDLDLANNRLIISGKGSLGLYSVDIDTGNRTQLNSNDPGYGENVHEVRFIATDPNNNRAYILKTDLNDFALLEVNLTTGFKTLITEFQGTDPLQAEDMFFDTDSGRLFISNRSAHTIIEVDPVTGDTTVVFDLSSLDNFALSMSDMQLDLENNIAYFDDDIHSKLYTVDLNSGDWKLMKGDWAGIGPPFNSIQGLDYDSATDRLLVLESRLGGNVLDVDLKTGDRSLISGSGVGTGSEYSNAKDLAFDPLERVVYVTGNGVIDVMKVELGTGDRTKFSNDNTTSGWFWNADNIALDIPNQRALITQFHVNTPGFNSDTLYSMSLLDGSVTTLSSDTIGLGPTYMTEYFDVAVHPVTSQIFLAAYQGIARSALMTLHPISMEKTFVSGEGAGSGPDMGPVQIVINPENNTAIIKDRAGPFFSVDLDLGTRVQLWPEQSMSLYLNSGSAPAMKLDLENRRIFVIDGAYSSVNVIDLDTGETAMASH